SFLADMVPLLHASRSEVEPIQYVISELVRNVLEHSGSATGAVLCAQYYAESKRLALGVADAGIGIRASLEGHFDVPNDLAANIGRNRRLNTGRSHDRPASRGDSKGVPHRPRRRPKKRVQETTIRVAPESGSFAEDKDVARRLRVEALEPALDRKSRIAVDF